MNSSIKVLLSSFDQKFNLISHFNIIDNVDKLTYKELEEEIYNRFNEYIRLKPLPFIRCGFMYIRDFKKGIEWIEWKDTLQPVSNKYITYIYISNKFKINKIPYE